LNTLKVSLRILVVGVLLVSALGIAYSQTTPNDVVSILLTAMPQAQITQEQFLRVFPALLGFGARINIDAPIEDFIALLTNLGVIPKRLEIAPGAPVTKGWASVLKVKALGIRPGLIEWGLIQIYGLTPEIAFAMAVRAGVMAPGKASDLETGIEFACDSLAVASMARARPLPGASIPAILAVINAITERVRTYETCLPIIPGMVPVPTS
jgi:hypothetical protein